MRGEVAQLEQRGMKVLVEIAAEWRRRREFLPPMSPRPQREVRADRITAMRVKKTQRAERPFSATLADGGTGIRDCQIGDGLPAVPVAGVQNAQGERGLEMLAYNCSSLSNLPRA